MVKRNVLRRLLDSEVGIPLQQVERVYVRFGNRKLIYFAGCDYFRLSSHPEVIASVRSGLERFGLSTSASRKTTGNHPLYDRAEKKIAQFFGAEASLLLSSGYLSNFAVAQALEGEVTLVLIDELSHRSLRDAVRLSGIKEISFRHRDPVDLFRKIKRFRGKYGIAVVSDGVFAHDGSVAPLSEYSKVLPPECLLWVDDAHAAGVLGRNGQGSISQAGLSRHNVIQTVTFSKAFGVYGGAVLTDSRRRAAVISKSSVLSGNTPLPLPLVNGVLTSLGLIRKDRSLRQRLEQNIQGFWNSLGFPKPDVLSPIVALGAKDVASLQTLLLRRGIYPSFIKYPGGPEEGYFRFALSSEHTPGQVDKLAAALRSRVWPVCAGLRAD